MNIFRKPRPQNLADWLEIATAELAPSAQDRICMDIASHYYEAVDEHERKGLSLSASKGAALAELGDARAAARRFRRAHLTEEESRRLAGLLKSCHPSLLVQFGGFVVFAELGALGHWRHGSIFSVVGVALFIVYEAVAYILARRKSPRRVVSMEAAGWFISGTPTLRAFLSHKYLSVWTNLLYFLVCLFVLRNCFSLFRLGNKMGTLPKTRWARQAQGGTRFHRTSPLPLDGTLVFPASFPG
jgi:hypothetical protein